MRPEEHATITPDEMLNGTRKTLKQRFDARVIDIQNAHKRAIDMRKAHMAARSLIDGFYDYRYERTVGALTPEVRIDFGRDAGNTVVLTGQYWSDPDYPIFDDIQLWVDQVRNVEFGGNVNRVTVGSKVAGYIGRNKQVLEQLDTRYRGGEATSVSRGIIRYANPVTYMGLLGPGLELYAYSDYVQNPDGTPVQLLAPEDVFLSCDGVEGVMAYGAIYDRGSLKSVDYFPKMFEENDPSELFIMTQSAPLAIPVFPNKTLKATVLPKPQ